VDRLRWLGGYVRQGKKGPVFIIEKVVGGRHFHVSTKCRTERAALRELERFESNPDGYDPRRRFEKSDDVPMTAELIDEHERWQLQVKRNTPEHVTACGTYLEAWLLELAGRDLRTLRLIDLKATLAKWKTAERHRVIAIKGFYRWLRQEKGLVRHAEDPTLDLPVPAARPAKLKRRRAVPFEHVEKALSILRGEVHDVLRLLAATGLHISEAARFAAGGELFEPTPEQKGKGVVANLAVKHKSGQLHVVALTDQGALDAAKRLREAGRIPARTVLRDALQVACRQVKVPPFNMGVMRHSVATWLAQRGEPLSAIADFLGHRSPRTTASFYRDLGHTALALDVPKPQPVLKLIS